MQTSLTGLALALSVVAVAAAGYAFLQQPTAPADLEGRLATVDERLARIEDALAARERAARIAPGPSLAVREPRVVESTPAGLESPLEAGAAEREPGDTAPDPGGDPAEAAEEIKELVDAAVEKKAAQIQTMRDKKPSIDVFAKVLELTDEQRAAVEQDVVRSQHEIQAILEIPTGDGTIFMDELVEILADGIAKPGRNPGRGMKFFGRVVSETIPGTDETYAARVEKVKSSLRETFKRNWTEKQYAIFESWQMDPTEVKEIEGSPWKVIETRVIARARELGATIPDPDDGPR